MGRRHAVIGYGRLARALVPALQATGDTVVIGRRGPGPGEFSPEAATQAADWAWLTVPDDHIAATAAALPWRAGQLALHCSGATPLAALAPAPAVAGFHPLKLLAGDAGLAGAHVGIEADAAHRPALEALAHALGLVPLSLPSPMSAQARAAYHAAANLAASGVLAVLAEAGALWSAAGLDGGQSLAALLPLARGALDTAAARGLAGAVSGPIARGDAGVLARHLEALAGAGLDGDLLRALGLRQLALAQAAGRLDLAQVTALRALLAASA
ncbi:DUF2520 domain-containing protein [Roseateles saccharophilus]|uniref:Putative short-subunit dehydrogenase-like oxidoreductase (DUF2520 family) n=1 Tax=Roseateles saccharophilus TaxID=304 RepID=A0A4R3VE71_ROSSA|nr:DUF2520 domain-containing protein [Roseateles saccharophilus]MDG0834406.1 DUF2520 domain-containing protein [Roseateles saccharophilus]TCV02012.1 putative short-subunit dehydrogenase-like oxidoreductase (DUF2520 family) [Roseateles saccharophilus]